MEQQKHEKESQHGKQFNTSTSEQKTNTDNNNFGEYEKKPIGDTPFTWVRHQTQGTWIGLGKYKVTESFDNKETDKVTPRELLDLQLPNILVNLFAMFSEFTKLEVINELVKKEIPKDELNPDQTKIQYRDMSDRQLE